MNITQAIWTLVVGVCVTIWAIAMLWISEAEEC